MDVKVRLDDGVVVELSHQAAEDVYDMLWMTAGAVRGAVTAAAKLRYALRQAPSLATVALDPAESRVFCAAYRGLS